MNRESTVTFEVLIRGKNVRGMSFVGIAFRGVDDATEPCLVVNELTDRVGGRVDLWMGNNSDGAFAEFVLKPTGE